MIERIKLLEYLNEFLNPSGFNDFCPNGLQVEGATDISKLIAGVTASEALIQAAIAQQADTILVHHGYFWKGEDPVVKGIKQRRLKLLLEHNINLLAYHLPLDAHPVVGNNAQLAVLLDIDVQEISQKKGFKGLLWAGHLQRPMTAGDLSTHISDRMGGRQPLHIGHPERQVETIAWCSGGGQSYIEEAVSMGVVAYLTGAASEQTTHIAREYGIEFYAAGHHATEKGGPIALANHLSNTFDIDATFIDIENPV